MKILDVLNSPWAIVPEKLAEITEIYSRHLRGEKVDIKALEAQLGPMNSQPKGYEVIDGVALLPVEGVLAKKMNLFLRISGGTSMQLLARDLRQALGDSNVESVVLVIDSPGGTVDGVEELGRAVFAARDGEKPVVAWVDGMMASAAYWVGAAADAVYVGAETDVVGSIGVATQHVDYSEMDKKSGIKVTDIYAGKYKRIASENAPLSDEGRAVIQAEIDYLYKVFVDTVARQRGATVDQVLENMADGRLFIGRQAITAGLVDGASTLEALIGDLAAGTYRRMRASTAGAAARTQIDMGAGGALEPPTDSQEQRPMNREQFEKDHPEIAKAMREESYSAGAAAERQRIQDVEAQALPGHEKLIAELKFDGKTTGAEAAVSILAAEKAKLGAIAKDLKADAPAPAPAAPSASGDRSGQDDSEGLSLEERCKRNWDKDAKLRAEFTGYEAYLAFEKANASGRVKILRGKQAA